MSTLATSRGETITLVKGTLTLAKVLAGKDRSVQAELYEMTDAEDVKSDQKEFQQTVADSKAKFQQELKDYQAQLAKYSKDVEEFKKRKVELQTANDAIAAQIVDLLDILGRALS